MENSQFTYPLDPTTQEILERFLIDYFQSGFRAPSYTSTARDLLIASPGQIIFNTTTSKLNFYTGSAWEAVTSA